MTIRAYSDSDRRAVLWNAALHLGTFTIAQITGEAGCEYHAVRATLREWETQGKVRCDRPRDRRGIKGTPLVWTVTVAPTPAAEEGSGTPLERCWRAARGLREFSPAVLAMHAASATVPVAEEDAASLCRTLLRAGYLRVLQKAVPKRQSAVYRLIRDTGPQVPVERRVVTVWDPNLCEYTHIAEPRS